MLIFKVLHIISMFTMVTSFLGPEVFYAYAIWHRDAHALAWVHRTVQRTRFAIVALVALIAGVVFGLLTAATGGLDFFKGWLIAAYVLVALFFVNAFLLAEPIIRMADKAIAADAAQVANEGIARDWPRGRGALLLAINSVFFTAIIADMVLKPF